MRRFIDSLTEAVLVLTLVITGLCAGFAMTRVAFAVIAQHATEAVVPLVPPVIEGVPAVPVAPAPAPAKNWRKQVRQDRVLAYSGGMLLEALSNATPAYTPGASFAKQFMKQVGVQIQLGVLTDANLVPHDPAAAFATGFLIGL